MFIREKTGVKNLCKALEITEKGQWKHSPAFVAHPQAARLPVHCGNEGVAADRPEDEVTFREKAQILMSAAMREDDVAVVPLFTASYCTQEEVTVEVFVVGTQIDVAPLSFEIVKQKSEIIHEILVREVMPSTHERLVITAPDVKPDAHSGVVRRQHIASCSSLYSIVKGKELPYLVHIFRQKTAITDIPPFDNGIA